MILLFVMSITTLFCVNQLTESHRYIVESHKFIKNLDNSKYDINTNDNTQQDMICKIRLILLRMEYEPENLKHKEDMEWLVSKVKEREHHKIDKHCDNISKNISNFLNLLPYLIIFSVILINIAFHNKRCPDVKSDK